MSEETKDSFERGFFWELYQDLERQFVTILEYVPYLKGNETTYSFRLINLILSIGGHVDSAFLEMARYSGFAQDDKCSKIVRDKEKFDEFKECKRRKSEWEGAKQSPPGLVDYLRTFEPIYGLTKMEVIFKRLPKREPLVLFAKEGSRIKVPRWWDIYNNVKHDVGVGIRDATLENARDALATAFLLNTLHIPSALRLLDFGVLKQGVAHEGLHGISVIDPIPHVRSFIEEKRRFSGFVSTYVFIYDYNQRGREG